MRVQLIRYRGRIVAWASATRFGLADDLAHLANGDPELTFVLLMCAYARDVINGRLPGPYTDDHARAYARAALIPAELLERPISNPTRTALALKIPVDELLHAQATAMYGPAQGE